MAYDPNKERVFKKMAREMMFDQVREKLHGPAGSALLFPGENCVDLIQGLELGVFKKNTYFCLIERDWEIADKIEKTCKRLRLNFDIFDEDVTKIDFNSECFEGWDFDIAFFDFCGPMTENIFRFLYKLEQIDFKAEILGFTFSAVNRGLSNFPKNNPTISRWFKTPEMTMVMPNLKDSRKTAEWACDKALLALGLRSSSIIDYVHYKERGTSTPMVSFFLDQSKSTVRPANRIKEVVFEKTNSPKRKTNSQDEKTEVELKKLSTMTSGQMAAYSRKKNKLQREYDAAKSAGIKAAIKREMNALAA